MQILAEMKNSPDHLDEVLNNARCTVDETCQYIETVMADLKAEKRRRKERKKKFFSFLFKKRK